MSRPTYNKNAKERIAFILEAVESASEHIAEGTLIETMDHLKWLYDRADSKPVQVQALTPAQVWALANPALRPPAPVPPAVAPRPAPAQPRQAPAQRRTTRKLENMVMPHNQLLQATHGQEVVRLRWDSRDKMLQEINRDTGEVIAQYIAPSGFFRQKWAYHCNGWEHIRLLHPTDDLRNFPGGLRVGDSLGTFYDANHN